MPMLRPSGRHPRRSKSAWHSARSSSDQPLANTTKEDVQRYLLSGISSDHAPPKASIASPIRIRKRSPRSRSPIFAGGVPGRRPSAMETPTTKRKAGKIRSVGVKPFQRACWSGA